MSREAEIIKFERRVDMPEMDMVAMIDADLADLRTRILDHDLLHIEASVTHLMFVASDLCAEDIAKYVELYRTHLSNILADPVHADAVRTMIKEMILHHLEIINPEQITVTSESIYLDKPTGQRYRLSIIMMQGTLFLRRLDIVI